MAKEPVNIGVVCLARKTFDYEAAAAIYQTFQEKMRKIEDTNFIFIPDLVIDPEDADSAVNILSIKKPDALICISGTFHLGHLILAINKSLNIPIMLWAPDELPYDGGKIRLNSVCGLNLNASNLYKGGTRNFYAHFGNDVDTDWIDAIRIKKALSVSRIAIAGFRAKGFFNLGIYDLKAYQDLGILVDHFELSDIFNQEFNPASVKQKKEEIRSIFDVTHISDQQLDKTAELAEKLDAFMNSNNLSALALRCWPEFAEGFGIAPCAAKSYLLSHKKHIIACEGDLEGALSMIAHRAVGGETPFLADLSQVNFQEDYALLWHCGDAPCNLHDKKCNMAFDSYHMGGKGVTADFVLKCGEVSILRIDSDSEKYRIFLQKGQSLPMEKELKGTYAKVRFDKPVREVIETLVYGGIAHHVSMVYGDFIKPFEIFSRLNNWEIIR